MRWTIRKKLTSVILLLVLVSIGALGGYLYHVSKKSLEERIGRGLYLQAQAMIAQIDRMIYEREHHIQDWAAEEVMLELLTDDPDGLLRNYLIGRKKEFGFYSDVLVVDSSGKIVASSSTQFAARSVRDEIWFKQTLESRQGRAFHLSNSKLFGVQPTLFAVPILSGAFASNEGSRKNLANERENFLEVLKTWQTPTLGVLVVILDWPEMVELLNTMPVAEGKSQTPDAYALLLGRDGMALTQPYFEERAVMFHENLIRSGMEAARKASEGESGFTLEMGPYARKDLIGFASSKGYRDFKGFGWSVLVFQNEREALAPIIQLRLQILLIGILVALVASSISLVLTAGITRPVEKLAYFTRAVGQGDFSGSVEVRSGDEIGMLAVSFNEMITSLKKAKNEILSARDFTDNIIKSIVDVLFVLDPQGRVKAMNPAALRLLGFEEKELLGRSIECVLAKEHAADPKLMASLCGGSLLNTDLQYKTKQDEIIPVLVSATVLLNQFGMAEGTVLVARDMREYKSLELQFREAQKMDAVGRLAGAIAHDFNNVLTVVIGYSDKMLRKVALAPPQKADVEEIRKAGRRATHLVRQLLTFSRRDVVKPQLIDINTLIVGVNKMLRLIVGEPIELVMLPVEKLWPVMIDPNQLEQVVTNLTTNARDAMLEGGKLVFTTRNVTLTGDEAPRLRSGRSPERFESKDEAARVKGLKGGDYVLLEVRDTGSGMTEEIKQKIFAPFFTTKPKGKGTGLGLATCFGIIQGAGGAIDVETAPGKGTAFKIYLPRAHGKAQNVMEEESEEPLPTGSETVLLVDDEDLVRDFAARFLIEQGYRVLPATNGSEALRIAEEHRAEKVHLLLTDVMMPKMGGRELSERILDVYPHIKILFMSGYMDDETMHNDISSAAVAFIAKPLTPGTLAAKVREVLDHETAK